MSKELKLEQISIQNFLCFREAVTLPLADQGMILVRGDNRISAAADANGVGKTAIIDSLSWVLFGETLRGLKADDVICRFSEGSCRVELIFTCQGKRWTLTRSRPHRVTLSDGKDLVTGDEVKTKLEDVLGFGFRTFRNAIVFGQGAFERFALADTSEQMRMLDEIQGIDLRKALKAAQERKRLASNARASAGQSIDSEQARLDDSTDTVNSLMEAQERFKETKRVRIETLQSELEKANRSFDEVMRQIREARKADKKRALMIKRFEEQDAIRREIAEALDSAFKANSVLTTQTEMQEQLQREIANLVESGVCPTCRRTVKDESTLKAGFEKETSKVNNRVAQASKTANLADAEVKAAQKRLRELVAVHRGEITRDDIPDAQPIEQLKRTASGIKQAKMDAEARLKEAQESIWEAQQALVAARGAQQDARARLVKFNKDFDKADVDYRIADYWTTAFGDKGIRSLLVDSVAGYLNERLSSHLKDLAAGEVKVTVSALTKLKGGTTKEKLSLDVDWMWGAESYMGGSGGQDRRIDLALFLSLQDLAEARSAQPFPIRFFDQPEEGLDAQGLERFGKWVQKEAKQRGTAFLITHNPILADSIEPDQVWTVTLGEDGSTVAQE